MPDSSLTDIALEAGKLATAGGGGAGIVGLWNKYRSEKRDERLERILNEQNIALALLKQSLEQIVQELKRHEDFGERLALVEQKVNAAHARLDEVRKRR